MPGIGGPVSWGYNVMSSLFGNSASGTSYEASLNNDLFNQAAQQQMAYQTQSAERAMEFSAEQAQMNREWQERMSNTAYQRAVSDLKKAGLNPILAYTNGPAATPAGSSAQGFVQSGAMANVDTNDWNSNKTMATASLLQAIGSLFTNSAGLLASKPSFGFGK